MATGGGGEQLTDRARCAGLTTTAIGASKQATIAHLRNNAMCTAQRFNPTIPQLYLSYNSTTQARTTSG